MKRFFTMIVAACAFFAASAQYPLVTLSHNGELSFFDDLYAFESAYNKAENGDTLYLSEGEFILNSGSFTIKKRLSVVGNGYGSHILGNLTISMYDNPNSVMDAPLFDGVRLDKLYFHSQSISADNLNSFEIRRCWIRTLDNGAYAVNNVAYNNCYIENADFRGNGTVMLNNSKVNCKSYGSFLFEVTAVNSNIVMTDYYPLTAISCILRQVNSMQPSVADNSASVINSLLDFTPTASDLYQHDCYYLESSSEPILDDKLNCTLNLKEAGYLGQDGVTEVGIYGGESPFSENPSVPTVDTANSSVEYDSSANKLKVSITVKAD